MKVLCFGAGGFIGSHLTQKLLSEGHTVTGIDLYTEKLRELLNHDRLTFIQQDVRQNAFDMDELVESADLVVDLIAYANPGLYVKIPLEVFRLNFLENLKIVEACVKANKRLIQFSTSEVYGKTLAQVNTNNLSHEEARNCAVFSEDETNFILGPVCKHRWIYASAKELLERVIHAYGLEKGFNYTIIRPFNIIGPKIDYLLSETDGIPRVFSFFMDALIKGTEMQLVDGGKNRRCYTYIDDTIDCIYRIVENPKGVCNRQIFNIGSPENEVSIRELAEMMQEIYADKFRNSDVPLPLIREVTAKEFYGDGYEDSDRRIPDITKARTLLNWHPRWGIRETLVATMEYYVRDYLKYYREDNKTSGYIHDIFNKAVSAQ